LASPASMATVKAAIGSGPIDITIGGWGQDGHVAYNQARRHPFYRITIEELASSTIRIQDNNVDTIIALAQRSSGAAYQFVPPMSVTLGIRECLSAKKVCVYSDTGSWKQTARVIDKNLSHQFSGDGEKMRPPFPGERLHPDQPEIRFIHQGSALQSVIRAFATEMKVSNAP
jgi:hypothetical protein